MSISIKSILDAGNHAIPIDVECHVSNGLPAVIIVGFASKAVDESKERIRSAFASSSLDMPKKRITINLAPADVPKDSTSFDLPILVSILAASGQVAKVPDGQTIFIGELGLDGCVRSIRGIVGKLLAGRSKAFTTFYIPADNLPQARLVPGIDLVPVKNIRDLYLDLTETVKLPRLRSGTQDIKQVLPSQEITDFSEIVGQARAKRALQIAAAGAHNILMNGPPGTGKSMLARALPSILPSMNLEEILEVTHLHSLASKNFEQIIFDRPFRSPHHSASEISITGGGQYPRPGEISLAHRGILMFDEFPEFKRPVIEALRQPLEDKIISVARARDTITFPADFLLVATSNPCPCGYYGTDKACNCSPHEVEKYRRKLSGPIIDRIDLYVDVDRVDHESLLQPTKVSSSTNIQNSVIAARSRQQKRYKDPLKQNASLSNRDVKHFVTLKPAAETLLNQAAKRLDISARSYMKIVKVAQTIADLSGDEAIEVPHISEALQYRRHVV